MYVITGISLGSRERLAAWLLANYYGRIGLSAPSEGEDECWNDPLQIEKR
jgi:hypothetical protein